MLQLHKLESIKKPRKRVGRGGSRGGTSGRGNKGQLARSGGRSEIKPFFEGGQMPLSRRLPKRGFKNIFAKKVEVVNLADLERCFDAQANVDIAALRKARLVQGRNVLVKLLGSGTLSKKLTVSVNAASAQAKEAVSKAGGEVLVVGE